MVFHRLANINICTHFTLIFFLYTAPTYFIASYLHSFLFSSSNVIDRHQFTINNNSSSSSSSSIPRTSKQSTKLRAENTPSRKQTFSDYRSLNFISDHAKELQTCRHIDYSNCWSSFQQNDQMCLRGRRLCGQNFHAHLLHDQHVSSVLCSNGLRQLFRYGDDQWGTVHLGSVWYGRSKW